MNELWFEKARTENVAKLAAQIKAGINQIWSQHLSEEENKEENTMKVSYKGVTGELVRLERVSGKPPMGSVWAVSNAADTVEIRPAHSWEMDIWDSSKECNVSFTGVSLKNVKFLGGEVTYG